MPPVPRWLVDDATPEALAGLLATYGRIALLSPEGDVFDQMAGRYNQAAGPNLGVYLKGHAGDLLKVDRRGRPPEYVERPCLTIGLTVQPEVLQGLAGRPGFGGRGLLARFLYSLPPESGRPPPARRPTRPPGGGRPLHPGAPSPGRQPDHSGAATTPPCSPSTHRRASCCSTSSATWSRGWPPTAATWPTWPAGRPSSPAPPAASPPSSTWPSHLRDGWAQPISADTFAGAIRLADYLIEHARAVFDLMGADPRIDDARWLLDWITRTNRTQFSRRDAHRAAPRGRFAKATDLEPALRLLEEHGYLRRVDPEPSQDPRGRGRPASPRFLVNPLPRAAEMTETPKTTAGAVSVDSGVSAARGWSPQ